MSIISANVIACEDVLTEKSEIFSAIKILSAMNVSRATTHVCLYTLATIFSTHSDYVQHVMSVRIDTPDGVRIAIGADYPFYYGYKVDPQGYGGFTLKTRFSLELSKLPGNLGWFLVSVDVDREVVAKTVFMLRWI